MASKVQQSSIDPEPGLGSPAEHSCLPDPDALTSSDSTGLQEGTKIEEGPWPFGLAFSSVPDGTAYECFSTVPSTANTDSCTNRTWEGMCNSCCFAWLVLLISISIQERWYPNGVLSRQLGYTRRIGHDEILFGRGKCGSRHKKNPFSGTMMVRRLHPFSQQKLPISMDSDAPARNDGSAPLILVTKMLVTLQGYRVE